MTVNSSGADFPYPNVSEASSPQAASIRQAPKVRTILLLLRAGVAVEDDTGFAFDLNAVDITYL